MRFNPDYMPGIGLGISQIMGYGVLYYAYAILLPEMAEPLGLSLSGIFGVLSLALFIGGFLSPVAGILTDRFGGRFVMTGGALCAGLATITLSLVEGRIGLFISILFIEAAAMFVLYPVAFASVARLDLSVSPQRSITVITLFGGVASTIFWPVTLALHDALDWRSVWLILGMAYLVICVPLHWLSLSGPERVLSAPKQNAVEDWPELKGAERKRGMLWMVTSFIFSGYLMGAVMTLWVTNVQDLGHTAAMAALAGAVIGPFKTVGRFLELLISRNLYPLLTYMLALGLVLSGFLTILTVGFTVPGIILAAALYGMGDGIKTIARGTLPLTLFGHKGFGARLGWINSASMAANASAPFAFAYLTKEFGGWISFVAMTAILAAAILFSFFIPDARKSQRSPAHDPA
ncbi:MAG: MFS transporter [Epibacterium sp.]|nr:MFS transporter [Epibacterium sp.]NQX71973.1 MFS transporter [Epibacterium sp.]